MTIPDWLKRVAAAWAETANLVSLSIVGAAFYLTGDSWLLVVGVAAEAAYLVLAALLSSRRLAGSGGGGGRPAGFVSSLAARYRGRLERLDPREQMRRAAARGENYVLDRTLLVVTVVGFTGIMFFGFGKHLLSHRWFYLSHAEGWEAGALRWTGIFLFYYFVKFRATGYVAFDKVIILILVFVIYRWLLPSAWDTMGQPFRHVQYVLGIAVCFLVIDLLSMLRIAKTAEDEKEKMLSRASFYWADIPMVVSFVVLLAYLFFHQDTESPEVFVSGVVACQLLISNVVFVVMEFGLLRPADR